MFIFLLCFFDYAKKPLFKISYQYILICKNNSARLSVMNKLLQLTGALYDETRIIVLAFLLTHGESCVCEISASLELTQSRLSRHVGILYDAGLLSMRRNGKWVYYGVRDDLDGAAKALVAQIATLELQMPPKIDACNISKRENSENSLNTLHG
jgi:ArsR family transcriptional regulator, arsenate/arsenite/antimonite-responsive transcriptional repressor